MERFSFGPDVAFAPREDLLEQVTVAPLSLRISDGSPVQAAIFRVAPGGRIVRHPATYPQILAVLEGSGEVSGATAPASRSHRRGRLLAAGEEHETTSRDGLTALIIEGDGLEPFGGL